MFENTSKIFKTLKKYGRTGWFLITLFASKIIFASYFSKNFCRFSNQKLSERIIFSSRWKIKVIFQITACLQLNFRPRVNSILCVVKVLIVFKTKKLKKKSIPPGWTHPACLDRGDILTPRQDWCQLTCAYIFLTSRGMTCRWASAFSQIFLTFAAMTLLWAA